MNATETKIQDELLDTFRKLERLIHEAKQDAESGLFFNIPDDALEISRIAATLLMHAEDLIEAADED